MLYPIEFKLLKIENFKHIISTLSEDKIPEITKKAMLKIESLDAKNYYGYLQVVVTSNQKRANLLERSIKEKPSFTKDFITNNKIFKRKSNSVSTPHEITEQLPPATENSVNTTKEAPLTSRKMTTVKSIYKHETKRVRKLIEELKGTIKGKAK